VLELAIPCHVEHLQIRDFLRLTDGKPEAGWKAWSTTNQEARVVLEEEGP
jgi:hypothetical protein